MKDRPKKLTELINRWLRGDRTEDEELWEYLVPQLRRIAAPLLRRCRPHHTLQPGDILNELHLEFSRDPDLDCRSEDHFYSLAARAMRFFLVDYERAHVRRPQGQPRTTINTDMVLDRDRDPLGMIAFDDLLTELATFAPRSAEVIELKVFTGRTWDQISKITGRSVSTVKRDWKDGASWIRSQYAERKRSG
jgi:RNA polymerase sigma factor (TIGR02999 family)